MPNNSDPLLKTSLCFVLTSPFVLNAFLLRHLKSLADEHSVTVCINMHESAISPQIDPRIELLHFPIARRIHPPNDIFCLIWLFRLFLRRRFSAVHSLTPKGGLLAMVASRVARISVRTHTFTGQVWANRKGVSRALLKLMDKLISACATSLHADSPSQATFLEMEGVCAPDTVKVFGSGSISGVDIARFTPKPERRASIRLELGIPSLATVFVFVGRLQFDKGVTLLASSFSRLSASNPDVWLVFVGPDEGNLASTLKEMSGERCRIVGLTDRPEQYLDAADVLCLPSYREGFGTVVIEAAAMGVPAIASRIYGLTDAVVENSTGLLFPPGDAQALFDAMTQMCSPKLRQALGEEAQRRARAEFSSERITEHWRDFYADAVRINRAPSNMNESK